MQPVRFDFPVITNSDYTEELSFQVGNRYMDLTGHSFRAQFRTTPNSTTVIASLGMANLPGQEGLYVVEPAFGAVQVRIAWETVTRMFAAAYPSFLIGDAVSFYYDLLTTLPSGDQEVWLFGYLHVSKGVTNG